MNSKQEQYIYFENLEKTVKIGLAFYVTVLVLGLIVAIFGFQSVLDHWEKADWTVVVAEIVLTVNLYAALYYVIGKIHWIGELQIRIDQRFFGFLLKSNHVIFQTLVSSLQNENQKMFNDLSDSKKKTVAEAIFSRLSEDKQMFDALLKTDIFKSWIRYWVTIYGSTSFVLLVFISFLTAWLLKDEGGRLFFGINWFLAVGHLALSWSTGQYLVRKTEESVSKLLNRNRETVVLQLQQFLDPRPA